MIEFVSNESMINCFKTLFNIKWLAVLNWNYEYCKFGFTSIDGFLSSGC
jgi:hypothetical protein